MFTTTLIQAVRQIQNGDKRWIPEDLRGNSFFGNTDLWTYYALGPTTTECTFCTGYNQQSFTGAQLRQVFPDLEIEDEDTIYPNVHMTLWGTETCKCLLMREIEDRNPEDLVIWMGEKTPMYKEGEYVPR